MCDKLQAMLDAFNRAGTPLPPEFTRLHQELNRAGPNLRVDDFTRIFSDTITPVNEEPTFTNVYQLISSAVTDPTAPTSPEVLRWVEATRKIIRVFDNARARDVIQLTALLTRMRRFVTSMLDDIHAQTLQLNADGREALQNMERWKTSMGTLDPHRLTLAKLNEFIRVLQPTQPFGMSVYILYQYIDPANAQTKAMEFMGIIKLISDIINPFTQELAANDELTGWKYLHVPVPRP